MSQISNTYNDGFLGFPFLTGLGKCNEFLHLGVPQPLSLTQVPLLLLEFEMSPQRLMLKAWLPADGLLGSDWIMRVLT
jgi:hypothetical protein